jgi:hypothetical protein
LVLQRCIQSSFLYENRIGNEHAFSAELYVKYYNQEYPYERPYWVWFDTYSITSEGKQGSEINQANGKKIASGFELSLQNISEKIFRYRLAYTMGKVRNRFTDEKWYNDENDIRIGLKLMLATRLRKIHDFSFSCLAMDGRPYTNIDTVTDRSEWFTQRFDPTVFLSLRYSLLYTGKKISFSAYVDVQNILNQTHAIAMQEIDKYKRTERKMDGILPTAGVTISF